MNLLNTFDCLLSCFEDKNFTERYQDFPLGFYKRACSLAWKNSFQSSLLEKLFILARKECLIKEKFVIKYVLTYKNNNFIFYTNLNEDNNNEKRNHLLKIKSYAQKAMKRIISEWTPSSEDIRISIYRQCPFMQKKLLPDEEFVSYEKTFLNDNSTDIDKKETKEIIKNFLYKFALFKGFNSNEDPNQLNPKIDFFYHTPSEKFSDKIIYLIGEKKLVDSFFDELRKEKSSLHPKTLIDICIFSILKKKELFSEKLHILPEDLIDKLGI